MHTHAGNASVTLTFDHRVNVCRGTAMRSMSTKFSVDSSSIFPFRAWTHRQTHKQTNTRSHRHHWSLYARLDYHRPTWVTNDINYYCVTLLPRLAYCHKWKVTERLFKLHQCTHKSLNKEMHNVKSIFTIAAIKWFLTAFETLNLLTYLLILLIFKDEYTALCVRWQNIVQTTSELE